VATWNLSVDLRGQGNHLGNALRRDAQHARTLATAVRSARSEIRTLGQTAQTAGRHLRAMGQQADAGRARLARMGGQAGRSARDLRRLADAADHLQDRLQRIDREIRLQVRLDDQTGAGATALHSRVSDLGSLSSSVSIAARVDDQTAPGATAVRAAVTGLQRLSSDIAIGVRLEDQTAPGATAVRAAVAQLQQLSGDITIGVDLDDRTGPSATAVRAALADLQAQNLNLRAEIDLGNTAAAAAALQAVQQAARTASRTLRQLRDDALDTARALDQIGSSATTAVSGLTSLNDTARTSDTSLAALSTRTQTLSGDLSGLDSTITSLNGNLGGLGGSLGSTGNSVSNLSGRSRQLIAAAIALSTALIPIAASVAPLAAGLTAAAAGAGALGIAVAGQIKHLVEASEAQEKYDEAVREHGKASEEAAKAEVELMRQMADMPAATREAAAGWSVFKDQYMEMSDALADDTMPIATKSLALMGDQLPRIESMTVGASREVDRFVTILTGLSQSPGVDSLAERFEEFTTETLARANTGIIKFVTSLEQGEVGGTFREFMDYAKEVGPLVGDTLTELTRVLVHLLTATSDVGVGVLTVVNAFAQLVNAVPTELISTLLQIVFVFKAVQLAGAGLAALAPRLAAAAASTAAFGRAALFVGVAPAIAGVTRQLTLMQRASIVLSVLAVAVMGINQLADAAKGAPPDVDKLTTSLKELGQSGRFTGELAKTFGDMDGLVKKFKQIRTETSALEKVGDIADYMPGGRSITDLTGKVDELVRGSKSLNAVKEDFTGLDEALGQLAASGHADLAAEQFASVKEALRLEGVDAAAIKDMFPEYQAALALLAAEQKITAASMGVFGDQALATQKKLDAQKTSADGLRQSIVALNEVNRSALGGMIGFEQAIDDAAKAAAENAGALTMSKGALNLNSEEARKAATALTELGAKTDEAAAAARESGAPWSTVQGIYARGTAELIKTGQAMGLTKAQATQLAASILDIPTSKTTKIEMQREDAIAGLDAVIEKIRATPGAKTVTVGALTAGAITMLERVGFKTKTLPDGRVQVTALTGNALSNIGAVQAARDGLQDRTITITTQYVIKGKPGGVPSGTYYGSTAGRSADGNIYAPARPAPVRAYADGGMEQHVAQIAQPTFRMWAEPETGGEAYIPLAASKRPRSRAIAEETVRRLGGDPAQIEWHADGGVTDWRYDPASGSLYSPSDAAQAGRKTRKVKGKEISYFDLGAMEKRLKSTSAMTRRWNADLAKVADRVGGDVAEALAAMGTDGYELTKKMATGSTKYINDMAAALRGLAATAKASLTDYTRQMSKATAMDAKFATNLATLAGRGYGELAKQLAAQGDQAAMDLAAAAVSDSKKAGAANKAAQQANNALTGDQVEQLVAIIAAVTSSKTGIHDVAATTGLGEDEIIAVATKASGQIKSSLGSRATKFLADLARANKGLSYANGGIREGIYSTVNGAVTFAEPSTGGEAFIPLGANKRRAATRVLRDVANRFGVGLTDLAASQKVVVIKENGDTYVTVPAVRTGASASEIGAQVGWQMRRARRGGVNARA
jgi:hypothetical protein